MSDSIFEITKAASFDAAHYMPGPGAASHHRRMHGHSFKVEASVRGPAGADTGWVEDLGELDAALSAIAAELDHGLLNERPGLEIPTLEHLCLHFAERLKPRFPGLSRVVVSRPTIGESCALAVQT
jgi:6-pyruvoyltetrahydropterin/6-carboxytetrahydropterin synthase